MALAPFYKTVWVDEALSLVKNPDVLELLGHPYQRAPNDGAHQDWNINSERWHLVDRLGLAAVDVWSQWIPQAREAAKEFLRNETDLERLCQESVKRARQADEGRFAQLRSRMRYTDGATAEATGVLLAGEQALSKALYAAIREPRITLDTVVAAFVSPHPLPGITAASG